MSEPIRVLVVDDSALMRKLIPQILERDQSIRVIGTAMDGAFGLKKIEELKPHVVTLDLEMPRMDGIAMMRELTHRYRLPVILFSAHSQQGAQDTLKALSLGAFDFVTKPSSATSGQLDEIAQELTLKVKAAAMSRMPSRVPEISRPRPRVRSGKSKSQRPPSRVVAIGISTGGPNALEYMLSQIPADFSGCLLIAQHMPAGFTEMLARRLDENSLIEVHEAVSGDQLLAGRALICPGNRHLLVRRGSHGQIAVVSDTPRVNGHRPSADVLFRSVAAQFGSSAIALLMTGMGDDGADGAGAIKKAGGLAIAQSFASCVVDSMPRNAVSRGHITHIVELESLPSFLYAQCANYSETAQPLAYRGDVL